MAEKKHDVTKLPKWAQELIQDLSKNLDKPVIIHRGHIVQAQEEISKYLGRGFTLHTFVPDGKDNIGGTGEHTQDWRHRYVWVLIKTTSK